MKTAINYISTIAAILVLSYCWGMFAEDQGFSGMAIGTGSFCIGFFGGGIIYRWLSAEVSDEAK